MDSRGSAAGPPAAPAAQVHLAAGHEGSVKRAIVLLSGGLDSYTAAAIVRTHGFSLYALTLEYGQRHARELESAQAGARALGAERAPELALDLHALAGSSPTPAHPPI